MRTVVVDGNLHKPDDEMVVGVQMYLDEVRKRIGPRAQIFVETEVSLRPFFSVDPVLAECSGTADCIIVDPDTKRLTIVDLKYGKGIMVPGDAPQLRLYALMAHAKCAIADGFDEIETLVVQPRAAIESERIKPFVFEPFSLMEFVFEVTEAMNAAFREDAPLVPGGTQCRFCAARQTCPALAMAARDVARAAFEPLPAVSASVPVPKPSTASLPDPADATPETLGAWLDRRAVVNAWFEACEARAARLIEGGCHVPGYDLVRRAGHRKFVDPLPPEKASAALGLPVDRETPLENVLRAIGLQTGQIYDMDPRMRSPAQIEKLLDKDKRPILEHLIERPLGAPQLVKSDKSGRPALPPMFAALPAPEAVAK